ncbi:MAG: serine hydrolase domain-containing protein [Maricaulaceae bacterium]
MTDTPFTLDVAPGFEAVADVFRANFEDGGELGAQFCVLKNGQPLVDLKGGWADRAKTKPVDEDTLFGVFSSGKAIAALVIAWLADQDRLGYNQLVCSLWPEFTGHGKEALSVAQVLSHQTGLSGITNPEWTTADWFDWDKTCAELAAQEPIFPPASASGYSPVTYGFLVGEIARRADKHMRSLGQLLRDEFCAPHDIDVWLGLPEEHHARCADMQKPRRLTEFGDINAATKAAFFEKWSSAVGNITEWRKAQMAGSNCHATAKGLASLMQVYNNGRLNGQFLLAEDMVAAAAEPRISGQDQVLPFEVTFAAGVMHSAPNFYYGPNPETLGHSGWGGSCVFADKSTGLSGAYAMNRQDNSLMGDPRSVRLIDAVYGCL